MIALESFLVRSFDQDFLDLWWTFADASGKVSRYHIYIDRAIDGPVGPWTQIAGPFFNTGRFRDGDVDRFHNHRRYYYQLRVLDAETGNEQTFGPYTTDPQPDLIAQELRRHFVLLMKEFGGRVLIVFPVITKGFKCPTCTSIAADGRTTGRRRSQNCVDCWDTTYVGGFMSPVAVPGQIDVEVQNQQNTDIAVRAIEQTTARLPFFPPLKPGDMIVEAENIRWEVEPVRSTKKGRAIAHQEPVLMRIPSSDIRYKIPINVDPLMQFGAAREFERRMCLPEEVEETFENLGYFLDQLMGDNEG